MRRAFSAGPASQRQVSTGVVPATLARADCLPTRAPPASDVFLQRRCGNGGIASTCQLIRDPRLGCASADCFPNTGRPSSRVRMKRKPGHSAGTNPHYRRDREA